MEGALLTGKSRHRTRTLPAAPKAGHCEARKAGIVVNGSMGFPAITPHPRQSSVTALSRTPGRAMTPDVRRGGSDAEVVAQEGAADPDGLGRRQR